VSKKEEFFDVAEKMYIEEQKTQAEIASSLGLSERTVRYWCDEGLWGEKRKAYIRSRMSFSDEVFTFTQKLMKYIEDAIEANEDVPQSKIYLLNSLLDKVQKIKAYEKETSVNELAKDKAKSLSKDAIQQIRKEVLGLE
jgi:predicted transcriptional regulator